MRRRIRPFIPPPKAISAVNRRLAALPEGLRAHIERARAAAIPIAHALGAELPKVDFALAAHDLFRAEPDESLLAETKRLGLEMGEIERQHPMLLHGPVAGSWLEQEAGVADREVLDAVAYHTTYAPGLGVIAASVFLADKVEPDKIARETWLREISKLALAGRAPEAIVNYLTRLSENLRNEAAAPHPRSDQAIAWLRTMYRL